jgi:2-oxoglutarate ferredoxin oxidoreductase subunit alpha
MNNVNVQELQDVVIRFSGDSGDGMQLTGTLFSDTSALLGNGISTFPDYPAEIRAPQGTVAGVSGFQVHFGSYRIDNPGDYCDVLVAMNPAALKANRKWLKPGATVILDGDTLTEDNIRKAGFATLDPIEELGLSDYNVVAADITTMTREALADMELDNKSVVKCKNMFALGICFWIYNRPEDHAKQYLQSKFAKKNPLVAEANKRAIDAGYNYAANTHQFANTYTVAPAQLEKGTYRSINGNVATAWGFCAAAEKAGLPLFCGSYPITPATVILEELAKRKDLGVKTVQAEDEIAGICTSIGAAYAGNFAVTTTSGPGLSLKSEAMGLAVMAELPLVVVDVQRGGPSTGLPTKTEQSDLMQALYGRNGECPMVVVAASSPSDCFHYAFMASKIAMEHMTPVVLLTDGFIANGSEPWRIPQMSDYPTITPPVVEPHAEQDFMPYARNEKLARGWAFPGKKGLEHRIGGLEKDHLKGTISYDPANHQEMVTTRRRKVELVADSLPAPEVFGDEKAEVLVVGWGGTRGHLHSAVRDLQQQGRSIAHLHFNYIYPLPHGVEEVLSRYDRIVVCELNEGQFAAYLRQTFPSIRFEQYNKCEGQPFTLVELKDKFNTMF